MTKRLFAALICLLAAPALAADEHAGLEGAYLGVHAGVLLPQLGSTLPTALGGTIELGFRVWGGLVPFVSAGYARPGLTLTGEDPRLASGSYTTSIVQRELVVTAGAAWRFAVGDRLAFFAGAGARSYLLQTLADGSSGDAAFDAYSETSTTFGAVALAGGELRLGPGAATLILDVGGAPLRHLITGEVATTAAGLTVGYRLFF